MEEETILKEDGLLSKATSLSTEDSGAYPDETLLNSDDEYPSTQVKWSTEKPKARQEELPKPPRSPIKRRRDEDPPKKRSRRFQQENAENIKEKIRKSEESISKLQAHSDKGTCPKTLRYNARANISPDEEFKQDIALIRKNAQQKCM